MRRVAVRHYHRASILKTLFSRPIREHPLQMHLHTRADRILLGPKAPVSHVQSTSVLFAVPEPLRLPSPDGIDKGL